MQEEISVKQKQTNIYMMIGLVIIITIALILATIYNVDAASFPIALNITAGNIIVKANTSTYIYSHSPSYNTFSVNHDCPVCSSSAVCTFDSRQFNETIRKYYNWEIDYIGEKCGKTNVTLNCPTINFDNNETSLKNYFNTKMQEQKDFMMNNIAVETGKLETCRENILTEKTKTGECIVQRDSFSEQLNIKQIEIDEQQKTNNQLMWAFAPAIMLIIVLILPYIGVDYKEWIRR